MTDSSVIVIFYKDTGSWTAGPPTFLAVAEDYNAALKWIQNEVDGKHGSGRGYMQGKPAGWWIEQGVMVLKEVSVHT